MTCRVCGQFGDQIITYRHQMWGEEYLCANGEYFDARYCQPCIERHFKIGSNGWHNVTCDCAGVMSVYDQQLAPVFIEESPLPL